jgi:hypothetical protein
MDSEDEPRRGHPNDPALVRRQLAQNRLVLSPEERVELIASIDQQIAEIDARNPGRFPQK